MAKQQDLARFCARTLVDPRLKAALIVLVEVAGLRRAWINKFFHIANTLVGQEVLPDLWVAFTSQLTSMYDHIPVMQLRLSLHPYAEALLRAAPDTLFLQAENLIKETIEQTAKFPPAFEESTRIPGIEPAPKRTPVDIALEIGDLLTHTLERRVEEVGRTL